MANYTIDKIEYDGNVYELQDNKSGYITSESDPVFSNSPAAGITSSDITSWNNKVSDDKTWNGVELDQDTQQLTTCYVPTLSNYNSTSARMTYVTSSPSANKIAKYDSSKYLYSTTPSANDNSTKVATTAYVDSAIPDVSGKIDTAGTGLSKSGTTLNHSNSITAQATQAVYPIKYDAQGHITGAGSAVTVPTKTSDLTNDSGFITGYTETDPVFSASAAAGISASDITNWDGKQAALVSGTNIKTVNNESLLGSGDISISGGLQNLVDGSATGSVRGVRTTSEGSSYTMGTSAFAEGQDTKASGDYSHAEGRSSTASGVISHAEGGYTIASGEQSHAEGTNTEASGFYSHAQNNHTIAQRKSQTALGEYNIADTRGYFNYTYGNYIVIVGNGTGDSNRSNALTIDWSGNVDIASGAHYKINGTNLSASDVGAQPTLVSGTNIKTVNNTSLLGSGNIDTKESFKITLSHSGNTYSVDKTNAEISAAIANNKYVYLYDATNSISIGSTTKEIIIGTLESSEPSVPNFVRFTAIVDDNNSHNYLVAYFLPLDEDYSANIDVFPIITSRLSATSGGTTLSLVNTGDMHTWNNKQDSLVSGTNIKTINSTSLLGSGNISIDPGVTGANGSGAISVSGTPGSYPDSPVTGNITVSHSTSAGYKHIPSGGSSGQILGYGGSSGTASWVTPNSSTLVQIVRW